MFIIGAIGTAEVSVRKYRLSGKHWWSLNVTVIVSRSGATRSGPPSSGFSTTESTGSSPPGHCTAG